LQTVSATKLDGLQNECGDPQLSVFPTPLFTLLAK